MLRVGFLGTFAVSIEPHVRRRLAVPCALAILEEPSLGASLPGLDVLVTMSFDDAMGRKAAGLKLVQVPGAGLDRIDRAALPERTMLANVHGHETGIAEYVIGAMLWLTRDLSRVDAALRRGEWQSQWAIGMPAPPLWHELAGKTLGIVGYGRIGRAVAQRARGFNMTVCATRRDPTAALAEDGLAWLGGPERTDELLRQADYVLVAMPAAADTIGRIGRAELALMKPTAYLINVARAEIVEEAALYDALAARAIAGAALDVWYRYPEGPGATRPARLPFHELPNVLMTPHIAGWTEGMIEARSRLIAENIRRIAAGETPLSLVNP